MLKPGQHYLRPIEVVGDEVRIPLTRGYVATVDAADAPLVAGRNWSALITKDGMVYAVARIDGRFTYMHRLLVDAPKGSRVDHRDGNSVRNRRENIRFATNAQNLHNRAAQRNSTTGVKGVYRRPWGSYSAELWANGKKICLGTFPSLVEAAAARAAGSARYHGEFARTDWDGPRARPECVNRRVEGSDL